MWEGGDARGRKAGMRNVGRQGCEMWEGKNERCGKMDITIEEKNDFYRYP